MEINFYEILVAFAGGVFGSAIGAFPIWVLCGLAVLIGATLNLSIGNGDFMNLVAWGHFLGPQTSFAGGCAAAAYAARKGKIDNGRDICTALVGINDPRILLVGGIFGILGYIILKLILLVPNYSEIAWTNTIALAVILDMFVTRIVFGKTGLLGKVEKGTNRWISTEKGSWLPYQSSPEQLILLSIAIGAPASYLALILPGSSGLIFGFATVSYLFMIMGYKVPVTHHIALSASMITAATGSFAWGIAFAIMAAYLGEICAVWFLYHGDTHIDPPTMALVLTFTIYPIMDVVNCFHCNEYAAWGAALLIATIGWGFLKRKQKEV